MSGKEKNSSEYYHNKGQEDASEGKYEPPWGEFWEEFGGDKTSSDNESYNDGYHNTNDQKK